MALEKRDARQSGHRAEDAIFGGVSNVSICQRAYIVNRPKNFGDGQ